MPEPKYGRRKVRVDPRLEIPRGIIDVEIDPDAGTLQANARPVNNSYTGPIRNDGANGGLKPPVNADPVTAGASGTNAWGLATVVKQELVINSDGTLVAEVTFQLADGYDYEVRTNRV
jgi:hypothetical protein